MHKFIIDGVDLFIAKRMIDAIAIDADDERVVVRIRLNDGTSFFSDDELPNPKEARKNLIQAIANDENIDFGEMIVEEEDNE